MKNYLLNRKDLFTNLIYVNNIGKKTPEELLELASIIGEVPLPKTENQIRRFKALGEIPGVIKVTAGGLFGHKEVLDWHANLPSDPNRCSLILIYANKNSEGSITSWIDNRQSYDDLPKDIKERCKDIKFTCGFKRGNYTDDKFFNEHHNKDLIHNLVYTNEEGIKGLFFPFLQIMEGIPTDLFDYLKQHILQDKYRYDHHWKDGDVVISEQWLTIHKRHAFENMNERLMYRIAIK